VYVSNNFTTVNDVLTAFSKPYLGRGGALSPSVAAVSDDADINNPLLNTPETPLLWDSPHMTRRVAAQRSRFMIFGKDPDWLAKLERERNSRLVSITVPRGSINRIRQELKDGGITESVVFPDLDGLGRELKQVWQMRR
jgi:hypothetical protein